MFKENCLDYRVNSYDTVLQNLMEILDFDPEYRIFSRKKIMKTAGLTGFKWKKKQKNLFADYIW